MCFSCKHHFSFSYYRCASVDSGLLEAQQLSGGHKMRRDKNLDEQFYNGNSEMLEMGSFIFPNVYKIIQYNSIIRPKQMVILKSATFSQYSSLIFKT